MNVPSELNALGLWDFRIESYKDGVLTILGSTDFAYYHKAEIRFHSVCFLECATAFSHAYFDVASKEDANSVLAKSEDHEPGNTVFCILADHDQGNYSAKYFIVAERAECTIGTVYYYTRENLGPGERIASWVK